MAKLGVGIVGLPNVGKSTLFNAITRAGVLAENYPFATIDKNVGVVEVPDERLEALQKLFSKGARVPPLIPTHVEFVDIAGLVAGASRGEGLGNQFLAHIREVAAISEVVRCFPDPQVVHVTGKVDPLADIETIHTELALADLAVLEKRLEALKRSARNVKEDRPLEAALSEAYNHLAAGEPLRSYQTDPETQALLEQSYRELGLITAKPLIYVANVAESDLPQGENNPLVIAVQEQARAEGCPVVVISAQIEAELAELEASEASEYLQSLGLTEPGLNRLIRTAYQTLGLITFFTAGEKEVRAWTVRAGSTAPQAAGEIHSDLERGFIRAEVVPWDKLVTAGSYAAARERGWIRTEGKDYQVQDGDVIHILFNV